MYLGREKYHENDDFLLIYRRKTDSSELSNKSELKCSLLVGLEFYLSIFVRKKRCSYEVINDY